MTITDSNGQRVKASLGFGNWIALAGLIMTPAIPIIGMQLGMWRSQALLEHSDRRQDVTLNDHESRIRTTERVRPIRNVSNTEHGS